MKNYILDKDLNEIPVEPSKFKVGQTVWYIAPPGIVEESKIKRVFYNKNKQPFYQLEYASDNIYDLFLFDNKIDAEFLLSLMEDRDALRFLFKEIIKLAAVILKNNKTID